ncbi:MAG: glycosyltransferase family 2 protein [Verrucomicrobia bacterium]|nr:glycosyltransferase family 2 protein [Verrucomicrobiota bacterium]
MPIPEISIIVPFYNEAENILDLLTEIRTACPGAEIVTVDDGSTDSTNAVLRGEFGIQVVTFPINRGQSAALYAGLRRASGRICVMLDGDGQNDPADIPALIAALNDADLACGWRRNRRDTWNRRVSSRIANSIRRGFLKDGIRDTGCSLKALRREHIDLLVPFNGLHRYIPALLRNAGLRLVEVPVNHRPRLRGVSKYTIGGRALRGIRDLFGVSWLLTRQIRFPAGVLAPNPVSVRVE